MTARQIIGYLAEYEVMREHADRLTSDDPNRAIVLSKMGLVKNKLRKAVERLPKAK